MFEEFFDKCEIQDPEKITTEQSENIKASLREKIAADDSQPKLSGKEKEKDIMKSKSIRTIIIAAAIAVVGLGGVVGATAIGDFLTGREIAAELATKNSPSQEYYDKMAEAEKYTGREMHSAPWYDVMDVTEFVVREFNPAEYKGWEDDPHAIIFEHLEENGSGVAQLIKSDGNGGYLYMDELIEDELLLAAIAEGTEKYGDTFVIQY